MILPPVVAEALAKNPRLNSIVHATIEECSHIFTDRPEFFPEYTDHGPRHNQEVLLTALDVLTDEAIAMLSVEDCAVLVLAVLLHDCGMHLNGENFVELVSETNQSKTFLDRLAWHHVWNEFLVEARRFDGRQLIKMFGEAEPITVPPRDPAEFRKRDRLLIGEFLRRHHPRIAHDVSVFGFPGVAGERIRLIGRDAGDLAEISGIIARSHGMSMREATDIFDKSYHKRDYQGVHPPIIIAALRISDYLQIQASRAPKKDGRIRTLKSPFSVGEWRVHQSVRNITPADHDPEAIYVDALPDSAATFLTFKKWCTGFQNELDATWASLGEVYGRYGNQRFDKFQLKIRRIRTSIDDGAEFAKAVPYLPRKIAFEASSADLLGLLVAPLYGNRPEVGLREFIQNSLDAVLEREFITKNAPSEPIEGHNADVVVRPVLENGAVSQVIVCDRGIGMNSDIIQNYFLRAGASFRSSLTWKKEFASDKGTSSVARTGRFGIGALAGFLLGSRIHVQTRRYDADEGLEFSAEIDLECIEVRKCKCEVGTKITIEVDAENREAVGQLFSGAGGKAASWDWYCNTYPKLIRLDCEGNALPSRFIFKEDERWVAAEVEGYARVLWGRNPIRDLHGSRASFESVYSNGILISSCDWDGAANLLATESMSAAISVAAPTVLITDNDGRLPVNLQRDGFTGRDHSLAESLQVSVARELIAEAIAKAPELSPLSPDGQKQIGERRLSCSFNRNKFYRVDESHWCWEDGGWRIADPEFSGRRKNLLICLNEFGLPAEGITNSDLAEVSVLWADARLSTGNVKDLADFFRLVLRENYWNRNTQRTESVPLVPSDIVFSKAVASKVGRGGAPKYIERILQENTRDFGKAKLLSTIGKPHIFLERLLPIFKERDAESFAYILIRANARDLKFPDYVFSKVWRDIMGDAVIPLSFDERREAFPAAFSLLERRIMYHRSLLASKADRKRT